MARMFPEWEKRINKSLPPPWIKKNISPKNTEKSWLSDGDVVSILTEYTRTVSEESEETWQSLDFLLNLLQSKDHFICHRRNSRKCVGSGCQLFPQCNLHEGPHFPSKQNKKFKEVMGTVSFCEKWATWSVMLPHTRKHEGACLLSVAPSLPCSPDILPLFMGAEAPRHCSYPSLPRPRACWLLCFPREGTSIWPCKMARHLGSPAGSP